MASQRLEFPDFSILYTVPVYKGHIFYVSQFLLNIAHTVTGKNTHSSAGEVAPLTPEKCPKPDKWSRLDVQLEHFDRSRLGNDRPSQQEPHVTSSPRTPVKNDKGAS